MDSILNRIFDVCVYIYIYIYIFMIIYRFYRFEGALLALRDVELSKTFLDVLDDVGRNLLDSYTLYIYIYSFIAFAFIYAFVCRNGR
eukprot:COSAG06_NODE_4034_length_4639_cov_77.635711_7_plen_87_part_00